MKIIFLIAFVAGLAACGGGSSGSSGSGGNENTGSDGEPGQADVNCVIVNHTISLADGTNCTLLQQDAEVYNVTAGTLFCDGGAITYNGTTYNMSTLASNGLTVTCSNS